MMLQTPPRSAPGGLATSWRTRQHLPAVAFVSLLVGGALLAALAESVGPGVALAFVPAAVAAAHDATTRRLPDRWVAATALLATVAVTAGRGPGSFDLAVTSSAAAGLALLALHLASPRALGFGDVKFAAALGPLLVAGSTVDTLTGVGALVATWLCAASAGAIVHAAVTRRSTTPFGPALVVGVALVLVWGGIVR